MRWTPKEPPPNGSTRVRLRFAWLPELVNGHWVWLERFEVRELLVERHHWILLDTDPADCVERDWVEQERRLVGCKP